MARTSLSEFEGAGAGVGIGVNVGVGMNVGVGEGVGSGLGVDVGVGVIVGIGVGVNVGTGDGVGVGSKVGIASGIRSKNVICVGVTTPWGSWVLPAKPSSVVPGLFKSSAAWVVGREPSLAASRGALGNGYVMVPKAMTTANRMLMRLNFDIFRLLRLF